MSDIYAFNRAINHEAELILVADGHTPACDIDGNVIRSGFQMGLDPTTSPGNPHVMVMYLHPQILTDEEVERAHESNDARELVLAERAQRHADEARELLPAYAESLRRAGWAAEVGQRAWIVKAAAPRSAVSAAATA